jgi:glycerol-3-phosphate dehydrogenase subunit C
VTCYGDHNEPRVVEDLIAVLNHNGVPVRILKDARCCGMPKLELGDLKKVESLKDANLPTFLEAIDAGYDIMAMVPSCVLMYKQEVPLMFPGDEDVARIKAAFFDPFEYLMLRHKSGLARTEFTHGLGKVAYHAACHQRVQNIGMKTRDFLSLIPDTEVAYIDRCSGHDGTYAVKSETYEHAMKIARPVVRRVNDAAADTFGSDCPMAGRIIAHGMEGSGEAEHPVSMVRRAYGV